MAPFNTPAIDQLFAAILQLQNVEECHKFFEDICTIKEVQDMAQRLDAAVMLDEVNWLMVGSAALLAGVLSLLTSVGGLPEVEEVTE